MMMNFETFRVSQLHHINVKNRFIYYPIHLIRTMCAFRMQIKINICAFRHTILLFQWYFDHCNRAQCVDAFDLILIYMYRKRPIRAKSAAGGTEAQRGWRTTRQKVRKLCVVALCLNKFFCTAFSNNRELLDLLYMCFFWNGGNWWTSCFFFFVFFF